MSIEITMPRLSDTMEEGTLIKWRVKVGDKVKSGDLLADVETDKATMELQSYDDGTVAQIAIDEGQTVPVGQRILMIAEEGEKLDEVAAAAPAAAKAEPATAKSSPAGNGNTPQATSSTSGGTSGGSGGKTRVSPLARKLAEEHGVEIHTVLGTGPDGRIIKRDILAQVNEGAPQTQTATRAPATAPAAAAHAAIPASLEAKTIPVSNMRKTIARRLVESKTTIPHFQVTVSVNVDALLALRSTLNEQLANAADPASGGAVKLSVNDFIVRATATALARHPVVNSSWADDGIHQHGTVNIGVAVALPEEKGGGLVVPTIRDALNKGLRAISAETKTLAAKARDKGLTTEEMSDGTFTISNLGMFGVEHFTAIINPPQAAILAVGGAADQPVVEDGKLTTTKRMALTLSGDHRVVDGATGAQFLQTLRQLLENPAVLLV